MRLRKTTPRGQMEAKNPPAPPVTKVRIGDIDLVPPGERLPVGFQTRAVAGSAGLEGTKARQRDGMFHTRMEVSE